MMLVTSLNRHIAKAIVRITTAFIRSWVFIYLGLAITGSGHAQEPTNDEQESEPVTSEPETEPETTEEVGTVPSESDDESQSEPVETDISALGWPDEETSAESDEQKDQAKSKKDDAVKIEDDEVKIEDDEVKIEDDEVKIEDDEVKVDLGGGFILYYYQPLEGDGDNFFEVFEARLRLDAEFSIFGVHVAPVFRDTVERGFFPSATWIEEAYAQMTLSPITVKVGKVYRQFGKFWDNSFYGNVQEYDGLKLDPNHGISLEGIIAEEDPMGLKFYAQYFIIDGTTNYALPGRDTHTLADSHRRNQIVGRIEPFFKIGDSSIVKVGVSGEYFQADLATIGPQDVTRIAGDATVSVGSFSLWGEFSKQFGKHVVDFPFEPQYDQNGVLTVLGISSDRVTYLMAGCEYSYNRFTIRYNFNMGDYGYVDYIEMRHIPGLSVSLHKYLSLLLEWAYATYDSRGVTELIDNSINLTIHAKI